MQALTTLPAAGWAVLLVSGFWSLQFVETAIHRQRKLPSWGLPLGLLLVTGRLGLPLWLFVNTHPVLAAAQLTTEIVYVMVWQAPGEASMQVGTIYGELDHSPVCRCKSCG